MLIAYHAHHGQYDKGGYPYIFHPFHLAEQMQDEYTTCVALLHDVVEDTHITLAELSQQFPVEVINAIALLTHDASDYFTYVAAIKENPIAKAVKIADLTHNSDSSRLDSDKAHSESAKQRIEKYRIALQMLK